jgi:hypothetical protein
MWLRGLVVPGEYIEPCVVFQKPFHNHLSFPPTTTLRHFLLNHIISTLKLTLGKSHSSQGFSELFVKEILRGFPT